MNTGQWSRLRAWRPFWISRYGEKRPVLDATFGTYPWAKNLCCTPNDDCHSRRYTPKDKGFDFSQSGIEGSLFYLVIRKTRTGKTSWQNAKLLLGPDQQASIRDRIFEVYSGGE